MPVGLKMTVNVSLCGSIPRSEMHSCSHRSRLTASSEQTSRKTDQVIAMAASSLARKVSDDHVVSSSQQIEPPSWAVPAKGEAVLEVSTFWVRIITLSFRKGTRSFTTLIILSFLH